MRRKTYLSPAEQWDRTVELFLRSAPSSDAGDHRPYDARWYEWEIWYLGEIFTPHALFVPGDLVIVHCTNGRCRCPVWAVSSKGYRVRGYYMTYVRDRCRRIPNVRPSIALQGPDWIMTRGFPGRYKNSYTQFERGPLRIVQVPGDLASGRPDDPVLRRYVVETLRAGDAAVG